MSEHETLTELIAQLAESPESEAVSAELSALQSIYGEESLQLWRGNKNTASNFFRFEVSTSVPGDNEELGLRLLVSLPEQYPVGAAPQIQLLSKYIGSFGCDSRLFGLILRIYISTDGVKWTAGEACIFDGIETARDLCRVWYNSRVESNSQRANAGHDDAREEFASESPIEDATHDEDHPPGHLPPTAFNIPTIYEADPIVDRKSIFVGRACRISHPDQVQSIIAWLLTDRRISKAHHPAINAWRCRVNGVHHQDNDDDGESAAGGRLAHLLQILDIEEVLVIVTRYYGGVQLGPDRFKHINQAARNALERGGLLPTKSGSKSLR